MDDKRDGKHRKGLSGVGGAAAAATPLLLACLSGAYAQPAASPPPCSSGQLWLAAPPRPRRTSRGGLQAERRQGSSGAHRYTFGAYERQAERAGKRKGGGLAGEALTKLHVAVLSAQVGRTTES